MMYMLTRKKSYLEWNKSIVYQNIYLYFEKYIKLYNIFYILFINSNVISKLYRTGQTVEPSKHCKKKKQYRDISFCVLNTTSVLYFIQ